MGLVQEGQTTENLPQPDSSSEAIDSLVAFKGKFDPTLSEFLDLQIAEASRLTPEIAHTVESAAEFVLRGGKRLRPAFVSSAYEAVGGEDERSILFAAMSVELLHAAMLVHDDFMDKSDLRRGKPKCTGHSQKYMTMTSWETQ